MMSPSRMPAAAAGPPASTSVTKAPVDCDRPWLRNSRVAIGAVWLTAGALESANNVFIGRVSDRRGPLVPVRIGLMGTVVATLVLPWPENVYVLAVVIVLAALVFGTFYTPGMALLTHTAEHRGLDYGYAFALINLAWAPGQTIGSAAGALLLTDRARDDLVAGLFPPKPQ